MSLNTKSIIRDEIHRQLFSTPNAAPVEGSQAHLDAESLTKGQNILSALAQNLHDLSLMESKLNFMVREVRSSLRSK